MTAPEAAPGSAEPVESKAPSKPVVKATPAKKAPAKKTTARKPAAKKAASA